MSELLIGWWKVDLLPWIHITEDLSEAKDIRTSTTPVPSNSDVVFFGRSYQSVIYTK